MKHLILILFLLAAAVSALPADAGEPSLQTEIQMRDMVEYMNSPAYAGAVSADEHIVRCFELAKGRVPTATEFCTCRAMMNAGTVSRATILAWALIGSRETDAWEACDGFAARTRKSDLLPVENTKAAVRQLNSLSGTALKSAILDEVRATNEKALRQTRSEKAIEYVADESYNVYFGYLHAHCRLSDGMGEPEQAYADARSKGHMDYFALTDHGELLSLWPWEDKWEQLKSAARDADRPGEYAALWGFEWSSPIFGHINVINTEEMNSVLGSFSPSALYGWMNERPEGFGIFNHPGRITITMGDEHDSYRVNTAGMEAMVGIDLWHSGGNFSRNFYETNYFDQPNGKGWHIAPLGCEDNHSMNWGQSGQKRTAVLAKELTREAIVEAHKARRFYSTEDDGLLLDFRCAGYPMGARLSGDTPREFRVMASDRGGDFFEEARLYRAGELIETRAVWGQNLDVTFSDLVPGSYYYVVVRQRDDNDGDGRNDEAISAPIWFDVESPAPQTLGCAGIQPTTGTTRNTWIPPLTLGALALAALYGVRRAARRA